MPVFDDIEHASLTDVGIRRSHNQDNHAILLATDEHQWLSRGHVFLVADGMGAHAVGELASKLAVDIIPHAFDKHAPQGTSAALRKAFVEANASIHTKGQQNPDFAGMGTTASALVLRADGAWIGHVGDSRVYRVRDMVIDQLSFDHSMVWEYARRQKMDPEQVQGIPSNVIFRSLGPEPLVAVDIEGVHEVRSGDIYVLCSDGLSGQVTDSEIGAIVQALKPGEACRFLIDLANQRGGPDNITVLVARAGEQMATPPRPKEPWHRRFPWPLPALGLGTMLSAAAVYLAITGVMLLAGVSLLLALVMLVGGMVGLARLYSREKQRENEEAERPKPKIHRSQVCGIDKVLVEKMARATQLLKIQALEKHWEPDWDTYHSLIDVAETHQSRVDLVAAFRGYCKAMQVLMTASAHLRARGEVFQPVWDRKGGNGREQHSYRCENCGKTGHAHSPPFCCDKPMKRTP